MGSATEPDAAAAEQTTVDVALFAEVCTKADLVWVSVADLPERALWHVWLDGAVALVTGGREQTNPGWVDGQVVHIVARSKDKLTRVATAKAETELISPTSEQWQTVASALHPKRLNASDGEAQIARWKEESSLWLLRPTGEFVEGSGGYSGESHRAVPRPSDATTDKQRPFHFGKATRKRR